jgi:hypothetical protein
MNPVLLQLPPGFPFAFFTVFLSIGLIFGVWSIVCTWIIYRKAGKEGWESIVPFYNIYVLLKIVGKPGWWLILYFIPLVNFIYFIWTLNMLSKSFGKDSGFTVGLLFVGFIFRALLAFGDAIYQGPFGDKAAYEAYRNEHSFDFEKNNPQ